MTTLAELLSLVRQLQAARKETELRLLLYVPSIDATNRGGSWADADLMAEMQG